MEEIGKNISIYSQVERGGEEKDELIIKNYSYLFNMFSPILLFIIWFCLLIIWKYVKIMALNQGEVSATFYISIVIVASFIQVSIQRIRGFKKQPPIFKITNDSITVDEYIDNYKFRHIVKKNINEINNVQYILNSEVPHQYGKINKNSLLRRFFRADIGDMFIEMVLYFLSLTNLMMSLPIKIFILLKNREPLLLIKNNLLIEFNDETACVINIYKNSDYEKISDILKNNNIKIDNKLKLSIFLKQEK